MTTWKEQRGGTEDMRKKGVWGILIAYLFILICPSAVTATQTMNEEAVSTESSVMLPGTSGQFEVGEGTTDRNHSDTEMLLFSTTVILHLTMLISVGYRVKSQRGVHEQARFLKNAG